MPSPLPTWPSLAIHIPQALGSFYWSLYLQNDVLTQQKWGVGVGLYYPDVRKAKRLQGQRNPGSLTQIKLCTTDEKRINCGKLFKINLHDVLWFLVAPQTLRKPLNAISRENTSGRGAACKKTVTAGCVWKAWWKAGSSTQRASPGKLGTASSGAHSICPVRHHQPQPPVTKCPHLQMCLRSGFPMLSFFFFVSLHLYSHFFFTFSSPTPCSFNYSFDKYSPSIVWFKVVFLFPNSYPGLP